MAVKRYACYVIPHLRLTRTPLPLALGVDGAGEVAAVGERASVRVGDRVAWLSAPGSYAEMLAVPNQRIIPVPPGVSFEMAAGGLMR